MPWFALTTQLTISTPPSKVNQCHAQVVVFLLPLTHEPHPSGWQVKVHEAEGRA